MKTKINIRQQEWTTELICRVLQTSESKEREINGAMENVQNAEMRDLWSLPDI